VEQGAGTNIFRESRPPWVPRGKWLCSRADFCATTLPQLGHNPLLFSKNIIEYNDFSYTTVINAIYSCIYPSLYLVLSCLSELAVDTVSDLFLVSI